MNPEHDKLIPKSQAVKRYRDAGLQPNPAWLIEIGTYH